MKIRMSSGHVQLFLYFLILGIIGSLLLQIPAAYSDGKAVPYIDSLFTAISAACVTGLSTVDMSVYSRTGFCIILFLIEAGGLGIVTFITMISAMGSKKVSMVSSRIIRDYFIDDVDVNPNRILLSILRFTICIQILGGILLIPLFYKAGIKSFVFNSFFLSISAFCNAGFSIYSNNLASFSSNIPVNIVIMLLIASGGIGFIVMQNIWQFISKKKKLTTHTKLVLISTTILILLQAVIVLIFDSDGALKELSNAQKVCAAFFESVTLRTAGFETIAQNAFSPVTRLWSMLLMFIGGSPSSMAGGIKTTTFFTIILFFISGNMEKDSLRFFNREIGSSTIQKATKIMTKSFTIIFLSVFLMFIAEKTNLKAEIFSPSDLLFEVISAFGTVGLSQGITASLSNVGKCIIILTMYIGRTGLFAMALQIARQDRADRFVYYPEESVLIG